MKPRNILFAAAAALLASMRAVFAATPVAVWDGDFSPSELTKFAGYTLVDWQETHGGVSHEGGTATDYSSVTIDRNNQGLMFNASSAMPGVTVLVKYSNLESSSSTNRVLAASCVTSSHQYDRTGITLKTDGTLVGLWNSSTTANSDTDNGTASGSIAGSGVMAFTYSTAGTYLYYGESCADISTTAAWGSSGLKASADTAIYGAAIGGMNADASRNGYEAAKGMTIEALAVFNRVLTVAEMNAYIWPSEVQTISVDENTSVSALNEQIDSTNYKAAEVAVAAGVTITVDGAFTTALPIAVSSTGSITLSAESQPDASYFTGVDFSGVQGALLRSWLTTPGVVGFNFNSANGTDTSAALVAGMWQANASDASGTADLFGDGLSTLTWSSANTWEGGTYYFTDGYLDDPSGVTIKLSGVPYETYDVVIYASTDNGDGFTSKTVNGTSYTWNVAQGAVAAGSASWGKTALTTAIYGLNALRIKNLSGPLSISSVRNSSYRGGIAAIQIMPTDAPDVVKTYTLTLDDTATTWSAGTWTLDGATVSAPTAGNVVINATASTTLTIDADVTLSDVTVNGGDNIVVNLALGEKTAADGDTAATYYSFFAGKVAVASGVLQQGSAAVLGTTPVVTVADGATFDLNGLAPNGATVFYLAGDGAGDWPYALTSSSGEFGGTIKNMYLTGDATVGGEYKIVLGADWAASYCYLQNHTLVKTGTGELLVRNLNIPDDGTVIVRGGELHTDQWNCLNKNTSGTVTLKIEADGTVRGTNQQSNPPAATTLDWEGTLNTASRTFIVKSALSGGGTTANLNFEANATANLKRDLTITSSLTLSGDASFLKDAEATADVTVSPTALVASGTITVGAGVVFNLGTARPAASFTVDDEGTLVVQKSSATDVPVVNVSAEPANVVFKDENGTEIESPKLVYDSEAGTLTFYAGNIWTAADGTAFDTPANWSSGAAPANDENATLQISGDTEITIADAYTLDALVISGAGEVTFVGAGSVTAANILLENGATLKRDGATISATTGISLASGTVLKLDGVTEAASISGAGAVETYGAVTFNANNTFTGGLTVKSGSEARTIKTGIGGQAYGKNNYGQAIANLSRIVVEDGGSLDLANTVDACYAITIAGKGVCDAQSGVYKGALYNSGSEIGQNSRQTASLTLAADAMVRAESSNNGWGIVNSGHAASVLALNGHTLTVSGAGYFPIVNVNTASGTQTTGTLIADGVTLGLVGNADKASNLTGVNVVAKGCATINLATAPSAIGSLTLKPSASGTTATAWNLPSGCVTTLDTSNVNPSGLTVGQVLTLFTAPSGTELADSSFSFATGSRYTVAASGNKVTATVNALAPFFHYDFNAANSIAGDSTYNFGNLNPTFVSARNGRAGVFVSGTTPWYDNNNSGKSPFHAGDMTVMGLVKAKEANNTILWNFGSGWSTGIAVIAKDSTTFALVSWTGGAAGSEVVSVSNIDVLNKWHLVTVVANDLGTTLYVDGENASTATVLPSGITAVGQFGSIHGTAKNYNAIGTAGFLLDDWCVYDAALTKGEVAKKFLELCPPPTKIIMR